MSKAFPVTEIFGPTIQGEGELIGVPTMFIRFAGCDSQCTWCDTPYALKRGVQIGVMTSISIIKQIGRPQEPVSWVTLTGGNPLLYELGDLVSGLHVDGWKVAVETQGTIYRDWVKDVDILVVSPKPPSSGEVTDFLGLGKFLTHNHVVLKVVIFDELDYEFAVQARSLTHESIPLVLQVGNRVGRDNLHLLVKRLRWLTETALADRRLYNIRILPQLHIWLWGNRQGV